MSHRRRPPAPASPPASSPARGSWSQGNSQSIALAPSCKTARIARNVTSALATPAGPSHTPIGGETQLVGSRFDRGFREAPHRRKCGGGGGLAVRRLAAGLLPPASS